MELLEALAISSATARRAILEDDYRFLARLENRLRIESDQPAWALPTSERLRPLARRMGFKARTAPHDCSHELARAARAHPRNFESCFAPSGSTSKSSLFEIQLHASTKFTGGALKPNASE